MSENVEIVTRAIAASVSQPPDADALAALLHPDHVLTTDWGVESKTYLGVPGFLAAIAATGASRQSWRQEIERVLDGGESGVLVFMRLVAVGRHSGAPVDFPWAMAVTLRDGRLTSAQAFLDRSRALQAVGLEEQAMSEESPTPDLVELGRRFVEAASSRDVDTMLSFYGPDPVWESMGMATRFEGVAAIRGFYEDFLGAYEEFRAEPEETIELGKGVTFSVIVQQGRFAGSTAHVRMRFGAVTTWADGLIKHTTNYTDVDEARAAAERLAGERG